MRTFPEATTLNGSLAELQALLVARCRGRTGAI